jgi:lipopolysaccharide export system permease protein
MKLLNRYIIKSVLQTTLIVVIALISLDFFIELIGELGDIGEANYTLTQGLLYTLLEMPSDICQLFPIAGLVGCLLGLGVLASNSELIVMRASGLSIYQISRSVLYAVLLMVFLVSIIAEVITPTALRYADTLKALDKSGGQAVATQQGIWLRDGQSFIHIESVKNAEHLHGISRYIFSEDHHLTSVSYAKEAKYLNHEWIVHDIYQTDITESKTSTEQFDQASWVMNLNPTVLKLAQVAPYEMSLRRLREYIQYQKQNGLRYQVSALNFWQRIFQPLGTCIMLLLAIPFIFGPLRSVTMGLRLVSGVIVGFSFYMLNQFFGPFSLVYHFPPFIAAITPSLVFLVIGYFAMRRVG